MNQRAVRRPTRGREEKRVMGGWVAERCSLGRVTRVSTKLPAGVNPVTARHEPA